MKVFIVSDLDGQINKAFANEDLALQWIEKKSQKWARYCGGNTDIKVDSEIREWFDITDNGYEIPVQVPVKVVCDGTGSEYTITELNVEF